MPPPSAAQLASRIFLGPALRTQPDRRLVKLVREGHEAAFEEIVRRYRRPLERFAASIVDGRAEDVTQDAFSKALSALRGSENVIELRPWLYRIVRNTALNDLRDRPPAPEPLVETIEGDRSVVQETERREEISQLMMRLRALPEPQRAAIVMRELEGLSHAEIAGALGVSGGAARQAIFRARVALREGFGAAVPLPVLRALVTHGAEAGGAIATAGAATAAGAGAGAALGGLGAGGALKVGAAAALIAGSVGVGIAVQHHAGGTEAGEAAVVAAEPGSRGASGAGKAAHDGAGDGNDGWTAHGGGGDGGPGDSHGGSEGRPRGEAGSPEERAGGDPHNGFSPEHDDRGPGQEGGTSRGPGRAGNDASGSDGGSHSGGHHPGQGGGSQGDGDDGGGGGGHPSGEDSGDQDGETSSGAADGDPTPPEPPEESEETDSGSSGGGSTSGGSGHGEHHSGEVGP